MLDLPNAHLDVDDVEQLADWVDASALLASTGQIPIADVIDALFDSGLLNEPAKGRPTRKKPPPQESIQDLVRHHVEDVWRVLESRRRRLGEAYPFEIRKDRVIRSCDSWRQARCFAFLLFSDLGKAYGSVNVDFKPGSIFCRLFEKVVEASESLLFRGASVRFGHPTDTGWPVPVKERIEHLAERFALRADALDDKVHGRDKDLGLDVASRLSLGDEDEGLLVVLTQCATGENWTTKHEPSLDEWASLVRWKAVLVRAIAFPWRLRANPFIWREALRLDAVLLDRMRLLSSGNPDKRLDPAVVADLDAWCEGRVAEFPLLS